MTPVGEFKFNRAFGIADDPGCAMPYTKVTADHYWSGDPVYHYNELVDIRDYPELAMEDSEHIIDYTYHYQYCLNISYNAEGTPGLGSAIFLHCFGPAKPFTGGCVAIPEAYMKQFMQIVDKHRTMGVRTNADNPDDARRAISFGAEGIGLFRIEHMFYGENSEKPLEKLRNMILASTLEDRVKALDELEPDMKEYAKATLKVMDGKPLTFRLMDPPLHEFVPQSEEKQREVAKERGMKYEELHERVEAMHEVNPMMGLRGVRLGIIYPEITEMQFRALFSATAELMKEGHDPHLEIMVPLTINALELKHQKTIATKVKTEVEAKYGVTINYLFGTMIEIPRAALVANKIAEVAEFFSFGTNDLTQMTYGFSRDDVNSIVHKYIDEKIIPADPFNTFDQECVGQLVEFGVQRGRSTRANLKCGVCGEHGGDPASVEFFYKTGLNYVSCSPFRVPLARLAAAQAAIKASR